MSDPSTHQSEAPNAVGDYSIEDLRAMKPIGKAIPDLAVSQDADEMYIFTTKVVDKAPDQESEKSHGGGLSRLRDILKSTSPAERAYDKAHVEMIEGKYYSLSPEGQVIETTVTRRLKTMVGGIAYVGQVGGGM